MVMSMTPTSLTALNAFEVALHQHFFAAIVDLRTRAEFVEQHIPGAFFIDPDQPFDRQLTGVNSPSTPLILMLADGPSSEQSIRITQRLAEAGYTHSAGYLDGTLADWTALGLPLTGGDVENIQPQQLQALLSLPEDRRPIVLDVRDLHEYQGGTVPSARLLPMADLPDRLHELDPLQPVAVICDSGCRSQAAAAFLGKHGFVKVYDVLGGLPNWKDQGFLLERKDEE
jgi:rhodanese-related sulfurtransferase